MKSWINKKIKYLMWKKDKLFCKSFNSKQLETK